MLVKRDVMKNIFSVLSFGDGKNADGVLEFVFV